MSSSRKSLLGSTSLPEDSSSPAPVPKSRTVAAELGSVEGVPVLPPPPSFKSVTFAPGLSELSELSEEPGLDNIPTEGLPTGPAKPDKAKEES